MKPIKFKEATIELQKPKNMTEEECSPLWVFQDSKENISCWKAPFWTRVKFLFHGKVWLGILSGTTQPPCWVDVTNTVFLKDE